MGLEPDDSVDDVDAGALELASPRDVGLLVEASLDLDDGEHLDSGLRGIDEGVDDRRITGGAVERLLDRQHVLVRRGLLEEGLHTRGERIVGVMQQDIPAGHRIEDVDLVARLTQRQILVHLRDHLRIVQIIARHIGDIGHSGQVQRAGQVVDLRIVDAQFVLEHLEDAGVDVLRDLHAHGRTEAPAQQLLLQCLEQVLRIVLFDLEVFVAGDAEGRMVDDLHAVEQGAEVFGDDVLEGDEPGWDVASGGSVGRLGDVEEPGQTRGNLDPGEELLARLRRPQEHAEVEREARDVGERVRRIDGQRGEDGVDVAEEEFVDAGALVRGEVFDLDLRDRFRIEAGPDIVLE